MEDTIDASAPPAKRAKLSENSESTDVAPAVAASTTQEAPSSGWTDGWARELECGLSTFINTKTAPFKSVFKHRYARTHLTPVTAYRKLDMFALFVLIVAH